MAENKDDIGVNISADVAPLERALKKASEMFKNFGQLAKNTAKDMANAFKDVAKNPKNYIFNEFSKEAGFDPQAVEERIKELNRLEQNAFYNGGVSDEQRQAWEEEKNMLIEKMERYEEYIAKQTEHANKMEKLKERFRKLREKTSDIFSASGLGGGDTDKTNLSEALDDATRSLKRFIKGLIGVQTLTTLAKKLAGSNEELANSVKILWNVAGQAWAPLFNWLSSVIKQIVVYMASIYKYIFGVNILDKALKNGAKNAKSIKNSLAGFDEITNLDKGSGSDTGWLNDLKNLKLNMEWVEVFNELTGIPDLFKDIVGWIKDPSWENFDKILADTDGWLNLLNIGLIVLGGPFGAVVGWLGLISGLFEKLGIHVDEFTGTLAVDTSKWSDKLKEFGKKFEKWKQGIFDSITSAVQYVWGKIKSLFRGTDESMDGTKTKFGKFMDVVKSVVKGVVNFVIMCINGLITGLNAFLAPLRLLIIAVGKVMGKNYTLDNIKIPKIPYLETGTNFVASEGLAYLHQGEAVIPKKFNKEEYFGSGNEETNMLLTNILNIVSNMDMNPQVAVSDIVKGISKQSRIKGVSVV